MAQDLVLPPGYPEYEISSTEDVSPGYVFLGINTRAEDTWLLIMDNYGIPVFYRYYPEMHTYFQLQPSGYISFSMKLETGRTTAILDSCYNIIDLVPIQNGYTIDRHDFLHTSEGEYILLGEDPDTMDMSGIVEGGYPNATVEGAIIQIQNQDKEIVFEWNAMDHFTITDSWAPLAVLTVDNVHPNSIEEDLDGNLLLISRSMNEITKINRITGEIIWRLGGKNNQFSFANPSDAFSMPHSLGVLDNGNITIFDNGNLHSPPYSRAIEYSLNTDSMTIRKVWEYNADKKYFSRIKGSSQRMENGNAIICYGGRDDPAVLEVTSDGIVAMRISYPSEERYTVGDLTPVTYKYSWKTSLFYADRDSIDFGEWNGNSHPVQSMKIRNNSGRELELSNYHLHTDAFYFSEGVFPFTLSADEERSLDLYYHPASIDSTLVSDILTINSDIASDTLVQRISIQIHLKGTKTWSSVEERTGDRFRVFPNPLQNYLHIESHPSFRAAARIYSVNGSLLQRIDLFGDDNAIDLSDLENGLYIIEIIDMASVPVYRGKIVKD